MGTHTHIFGSFPIKTKKIEHMFSFSVVIKLVFVSELSAGEAYMIRTASQQTLLYLQLDMKAKHMPQGP